MISAKIVADSKNQFGERLTTMMVTFPRIVLAEFNTHRALSRNSASSRAIPFKRMVKMVTENPFIPIAFQAEHTGMQGTKYIPEHKVPSVTAEWLRARTSAVSWATELTSHGVTKQLANRLLEPFMWHTVLVTATEWENFFALRAHPDAEIHIAKLAEEMLFMYNDSTPKLLKDGEWYIPFGDSIDYADLAHACNFFGLTTEEAKIKIATARCARLSYMTLGDEPKIDYEADIKLHDILVKAGHMSPFEHCAKAMNEVEYNVSSRAEDNHKTYGWCGNFRGYIQYRKLLPGENKIDSRVIKK